MKIYVNAPGEAFCLSSTLTLKNHSFVKECPYRVKGPNGKTYDTQWSLIARKFNSIHVEVSASISDVFTGPQVFELVAGQTDVKRTPIAPEMLPLLNQIVLSIKPQNAPAYNVPLSFRETSSSVVHRMGPARTTLLTHAPHQFGGVHGVLDYRYGSNSVGLVLNFHNANFPAKGDFYFDSIELKLPAGLDFTEELVYGTRAGTYLVRPFQHIMPQRMEFSRRLQIHKTGEGIKKSIWGQGFQNYFNGGYLAQGHEIGHQGTAASKVANEYNSVKNAFDNNLPVMAGASPNPHVLWKCQNVTYGGMTGGIDVDAFPAGELADCKDVKGVETLFMKQYRYHCRHMGAIYQQASGAPILMETYLNPDGSTPWQMFANKFQNSGGSIKEAPFYFSKAVSNGGVCSYEWALKSWEPIDGQHLRRVEAQDAALAWLTNDALALNYLRMGGELTKMTYWTGIGGQFHPNHFTPGHGVGYGRDLGWALDMVCHAGLVSTGQRKTNNENWVKSVVSSIEKTQLPSGWINTNQWGKIATTPPFGDGNVGFYKVGQAYEHAFVCLALMAAYGWLGVGLNAVTKGIQAMYNYAWKAGSGGAYYYVPTHKRMPDGSYQLLQSIPMDGLMNTVDVETGEIGSLVGMAFTCKALVPTALLNPMAGLLMYTQKPDAQQALSSLQAVQNFEHLSNTLAIAQKQIGGQQE